MIRLLFLHLQARMLFLKQHVSLVGLQLQARMLLSFCDSIPILLIGQCDWDIQSVIAQL